jgi:K(+)-stimulated pyrophosphate-energized sodium pump
MMLPGAIAILSPLIIGFIFGPEALGGFLAGATVSGVLMGMFQNNAGGAWDNAKKSFEKGVEINGQMYYKKSEPHKASVTGDTVGDPFKDTSGPSMNILIKLMSIVSLVIAPTLGDLHNTRSEVAENKIEIKEVHNTNTDNTATAEFKNDALAVALEKDGLIKGDYTLEIENNGMIINGTKVSEEVYAKYKNLIPRAADTK